ncbi:hypothetical protein ACE6H2_007310 [Prunus campanulata]
MRGGKLSYPLLKSLEISKNKAVELVPSHVGGEDDDNILDMADYEEADNIEIDPGTYLFAQLTDIQASYDLPILQK